jgi:hypothetical protein
MFPPVIEAAQPAPASELELPHTGTVVIHRKVLPLTAMPNVLIAKTAAMLGGKDQARLSRVCRLVYSLATLGSDDRLLDAVYKADPGSGACDLAWARLVTRERAQELRQQFADAAAIAWVERGDWQSLAFQLNLLDRRSEYMWLLRWTQGSRWAADSSISLPFAEYLHGDVPAARLHASQDMVISEHRMSQMWACDVWTRIELLEGNLDAIEPDGPSVRLSAHWGVHAAVAELKLRHARNREDEDGVQTWDGVARMRLQLAEQQDQISSIIWFHAVTGDTAAARELVTGSRPIDKDLLPYLIGPLNRNQTELEAWNDLLEQRAELPHQLARIRLDISARPIPTEMQQEQSGTCSIS